MTPLALLLTIQETLPPPPEPSTTTDINTAQVVGIVILSLGLIVIAALAVRPLVSKRDQPETAPSEPTPPETATAPVPEPVAPRPIIQFPTPVARNPEPEDDWQESDPVIEERFGRVLGDPANRRKLGDRRPTRRAHDLAVAALHRLDTEPQGRGSSRTVVPIDERRLSAIERHPQAQIIPWQGPTGVRSPESAETSLEESFSRWPANDRATTAVQEPPATHDYFEPPIGEDATEEFVVVERAAPARESVPTKIFESDYGLDVEGVDTRTLAEISQVLRDLIYCANSGQLFHGFALYSDPYLFRFMDGTGLSEDEFRDVYGSIGSRPQEAWERLDRLSDVVRNPDGTVEATVSYVDVMGKPINGQERFRFAFDRERRVWMIDDIAPLEG